MVGWWLGAAINLVGSISINLGTNIMKLGHNKRAMLDLLEDQKPAVTRFREWQIGTAIFITGNILNFVSFGFAAQSLLAALGSVQFVSNVFFAGFVLKEKITMLIIVATCCIIGGCLLLVIFGNHSSAEYSVDQLLELYRQPPYIVYLVMMFVFVFGSYIIYLHGKHVAAQKGREDSMWVAILPVSYSIFSALLGTQSVLFSKSISVLLRTTVSGDNQLGNWYTWVTLLCFLITAGFWVTRLNKGLRLFPAMIIVPLMQICWTLFSIVSGMIYFQEYETFNPATSAHGPLNAIIFSLGVLIVFVGVFLLTKSGTKKSEEDDDQELDRVSKGQEMNVLDNPAYEAGGEPKDFTHPAAAAGAAVVGGAQAKADTADMPLTNKISMDSLRFTSLASTTTRSKAHLTGGRRPPGAPGSALVPSTLVKEGGADGVPTDPAAAPGVLSNDSSLNASKRHGTPGEEPYQPWHLSRISSDEEEGKGAAQQRHLHNGSLGATDSMMGTIKRNAKKWQAWLKRDFNVDPEDFKQMFGMGKGNYMPALSLFAMPAVDLTATHRRQGNSLRQRHTQHIANALPSSRFFDKDLEGCLQETRSENLDLAVEPLMGGQPGSSTAEPSGPSEAARLGPVGGALHDGVSSAMALGGFGAGGLLPRSSSFTLGSTGRGAGGLDAGALKDMMSKTVKQMEEVAARAKVSMEASVARYKEQRTQAYQALDSSGSVAADDAALPGPPPGLRSSQEAELTESASPLLGPLGRSEGGRLPGQDAGAGAGLPRHGSGAWLPLGLAVASGGEPLAHVVQEAGPVRTAAGAAAAGGPSSSTDGLAVAAPGGVRTGLLVMPPTPLQQPDLMMLSLD